MTRRKSQQFSIWQQTAVNELHVVARNLPADFKLRGRPEFTHWGYIRIPFRLTTAAIEQSQHGLPLHDHEDFVLWIGRSHFSAPTVEVEHNRFVGYPHVLHGRQLCIYLDPAREWNPRRGVRSAVDRLYDWLADAAAGRFDPGTSLFHAVGGVSYGSTRFPTIVVRDSETALRAQSGYLTRRADHRFDLDFVRESPDQIQVPVIGLSTPLPLGIGHTFFEVIKRLDSPISNGWLGIFPKVWTQSAGLLTSLAASASRLQADSPQVFVLKVPHPAGGPPHLLAGCLPAETANQLRSQIVDRKTHLININFKSLDLGSPVEWCPVSDERVSVTTRRDTSRPVNAFHRKTVQIWGCGGLGSWIAEFVARAGAQALVLCDPGIITGGLLVRQNFTELDVGNGKAQALRDRILAIRDDIQVDAYSGNIPDAPTSLASADVIIDATISHGIGQLLDSLAPADGRPLLAQVATDVKTGTLGILSVSAPGNPLGANEIDRQVGEIVKADGVLEQFHTFWTDVVAEDELIPTRGCSVPTFHGSAADMAGVAASLTSLLGTHLASKEPVSGTHLVALPYSPSGPAHRFVQPDC